MGKLIQDIKEPYKPEMPPESVMRLARRNEATHYITKVDTDLLVQELFNRGTSIEDIFGQYYAMEEMANARDDEIFGNDEEGQHGRPVLTVGDARLAGFGTPEVKHDQPF